MYKCECCGDTFESPLVKYEYNEIDGHIEKLRQVLCPLCKGPHFLHIGNDFEQDV